VILFRYILKSHVAPFFFSVFTLIAIFLLQFFMKFADRLVGKGLSTWLIIKLVVFNLAWMLVLIIPMSVLVATLMAFGGMAQNNEVAIMKASGISLYKMIVPPLLASVLIALGLVYFNNHIYPDANHAARLLLNDISRTKPTLALVPGVFSQEIEGYSILFRERKGDTLENLTIYDYAKYLNSNVVTAQKGKITFSNDQKKLILDLQNGEIHMLNKRDRQDYRILKFKKHQIAMNAAGFSFNQSTFGSSTRQDREMGAEMMMGLVDSIKQIEKRYLSEFKSSLDFYFCAPLPPNMYGRTAPGNSPDLMYMRIKEKINTAKSSVNSRLSSLNSQHESQDSLMVEVYKKYSIPFACIVFILIGAPLGTMTRRGGFGVAAGISLTFFLIFWICLIGGEKMADRGLLSPFLGMWSANFIMGAFGIFLLVKCAKEKVELNFDRLKKLIPKHLKAISEPNENN